MDLATEHVVTQFLTFHVAGGEYAVDILSAREIVTCETITPVPATSAFLRGVVGLRGVPVPVIDLALKLGRRETAITRAACIIVTDLRLETAAGETSLPMGIIVDAVGQVLELSPEAVLDIPALSPGLRVDYLTGMTATETGFVLFLDLPRALATLDLLDLVSLEALQRALEAAAAPSAEPAAEPAGAVATSAEAVAWTALGSAPTPAAHPRRRRSKGGAGR